MEGFLPYYVRFPFLIQSDMGGSLHTMGYKYLQEKKISEAVEVFQLNLRLHPDSWKSYDSLGKAYALSGQKDQAIQYYQKALELNPKDEAAKIALAQLKE